MEQYQAPWIGHPAEEKEPEPVAYCDWCGREIYAGEDYYDTGDTVCEDCISDCKKTA